MERLQESVKRHSRYPTNNIVHGMYAHSLNSYVERLNEHEDRIFCPRQKAAVDIWECKGQGQEFLHTLVRDLPQLEKHICTWGPDPRSRFVFLSAPNSRDSLNITREMLSLLFTYHQVMPGFLDFILTFGKRHHAQTFPFSGFRYHKRLSQTVKGTDIDVLCRSGQDLRLCYNLRSVEPSKRQQNWPWSIRQSAVYHFFDTTTARANWIVVKADKLMKERIISAAQPFGTSGISSFDTNSRAFAATLETHLLFLDWSGENWRWYIDSLENEAQKSTRRTLTIEVEKAPPPMSANPISSISRATTFATLSEQPSIIGGKTDMDEGRPRTPPGLRRACTDPSSFRIQHQGGTDAASYDCQPASPARSNADFSFSDLQRIHFLEEKANETVLVIESNLNVFYELVQFYQSIVDSEEFPGELRLCCKDDMERFISKAKNIENDLRMQQSRAKSLLRMLADRKSLLYGIIEYRSMEASRSLAEKTQLSADNMEIMTRDMHDIAQKTKQETVSMRIITLVTLFYLPGTFISTIMSTDIVRFGSENPASPKKKVSVEAIKLYMAVTLPLMVMTFGAWYGVYLWVNKREKRHNKDLEKGFGCFPENWEPAHISNPVAAKRFFHDTGSKYQLFENNIELGSFRVNLPGDHKRTNACAGLEIIA